MLEELFPNVNDEKLIECVFIGPQIRELMQDKQFDEDLNETERNAWLSFKRICIEITKQRTNRLDSQGLCSMQ